MLHPRKRFGQNFLCDKNVLQSIVDLINIKSHDHIVEIGPGLGVLTKEIASLTNKLDLIEIDRDLVIKLQELLVNKKHCQLHSSDILKFDLKKIFTGKKMRIVGNLPYNISTPLIFHLLKYQEIIFDMHFMLQLEVAERLAAKPNTKNYGRLSIMVQYYFDVEILLNVPPNAFTPIPKVESAFVRLIPKQKHEIEIINPENFAIVVREAFNMRRKTIQNSLKNIIDKNNNDFWQELKIDNKKRPEELAIADFVKISNAIKQQL